MDPSRRRTAATVRAIRRSPPLAVLVPLALVAAVTSCGDDSDDDAATGSLTADTTQATGAAATQSTGAPGTTDVDEYAIDYSQVAGRDVSRAGSTHELAFQPGTEHVWMTGQLDDSVVRIDADGEVTPHFIEKGAGPHGIVFDADGRLWVSLEFGGRIVELDPDTGEVLSEVSLLGTCDECDGGNPGAHGLAVAPDGRTLWYTGKEGNTVGRISPDAELSSFDLPDADSTPIYIAPGHDGAMWFTQLTGNRIGRVTDAGEITQFDIPTENSRPIAIVADPDGEHLWFSAEHSSKLGRVSADGTIVEVEVPREHEDYLLAALTIDEAGDFWVEQYVAADSDHDGHDRVIRIDGDAVRALPELLSAADLEIHEVPTPRSILHRIAVAPDGSVWFTELATDQAGTIYHHEISGDH